MPKTKKHPKSNRVLFICKKSDYHFGHLPPTSTTGLKTSALFCSETLRDSGIDADIVIVTDNNDIDREVTRYKPTHVIIEALWVVPEKFFLLRRLHPHVQWIIRTHSELPFTANEGISMDWLIKYVRQENVIISGNSRRLNDDLSVIVSSVYGWHKAQTAEKVVLLPNCYIFPENRVCAKMPCETLRVGCFGAIRPLKNQLIQAVAAIDFANRTGRKLEFHMNQDRVEQIGHPVKKNLINLFAHYSDYKLVLHPWLEREEFLDLLATMDLSMQVSFTESFNIVSADAAALDVPLAVSSEVYWASSRFYAEPTSRESIVDAMTAALRGWTVFNKNGLRKQANAARKIWVDYFTK